MPNWTYLTLHFFHTLALGLWIGGSVTLTVLVAPAVFAATGDRHQAGRVLSRIFRRFDRILLACVAALLLTSGAMLSLYGRMSPWYAIEYVCIALMSGSAIYTALFVNPRIHRVLHDPRAGEAELDRLRRTSELSLQFNLACAIVALLFS